MIRLEQAVFCERILRKTNGSVRAVCPREAITHGSPSGMILLLTFRGSAGRYDVRVICERPGGKLTGSPPEWVALDGRHERFVSLELDCSAPGLYRCTVFADSGATRLGVTELQVRAQ